MPHLKPAEAAEKRCPISRIEGRNYCCADQCMAWRWSHYVSSDPDKPYVFSSWKSGNVNVPTHGFCGLAQPPQGEV